MKLPNSIEESGRYKNIYIQSDIEQLRHTYYILKRIHRRFQMKSVRLIRLINKGKVSKYDNRFVMRSHTWEFAAKMIMEEMEGIKWQIQKIEQIIEKSTNS